MNTRIRFRFLLKSVFARAETLVMGTSLGTRVLFAHKTRRMLAIPSVVSIEVTNACNADCIMCPRKQMRRPVRKMEFILFKKIIGECVSIGVKKILPYLYGEPLLLPDLGRYLMYINQRAPKSKIILSTNGSLLTEEEPSIFFGAMYIPSLSLLMGIVRLLIKKQQETSSLGRLARTSLISLR